MKFLVLAIFALGLAGCTSGSMNPVQQAACDVEKVALTSVSQVIAGALNCSAPDAIEANLEVALGNVSFCQTPLQAPSALATVKALAAGQGWQTIGDIKIPGNGVKSLAVEPQGVVGAIACPIIVNTVLGYMTSSIPSAWKCSASSSAGSVSAAITAACIAAIPF